MINLWHKNRNSLSQGKTVRLIFLFLQREPRMELNILLLSQFKDEMLKPNSEIKNIILIKTKGNFYSENIGFFGAISI